MVEPEPCPTRLVAVVFDAVDHVAQARWWGKALDTPVTSEGDEWSGIEPAGAPMLDFGTVPEAKSGKNRTHLDLATYTATQHEQLVDRLVGLGAVRIDVGQPQDADWVVLADPEGNEFCVLEPRPEAGHEGLLGAIVVDTDELEATTAFWRVASGWDLVEADSTRASFRDPRRLGPYLELAATEGAKAGKSRIHLDVAPWPGQDQAAAVDALVAAGARRVDIGQRDVTWAVLQDPGGNELCVLTPR